MNGPHTPTPGETDSTVPNKAWPPPVWTELPIPEAITQAKMSSPGPQGNSHLGIQASKAVRDQVWGPPRLGKVHPVPPATLEGLGPNPGNLSHTVKAGTELQAWGCLKVQKGMQDQGPEGPWLECLKLSWVRGARASPKDQIRIRGGDIQGQGCGPKLGLLVNEPSFLELEVEELLQGAGAAAVLAVRGVVLAAVGDDPLQVGHKELPGHIVAASQPLSHGLQVWGSRRRNTALRG